MSRSILTSNWLLLQNYYSKKMRVDRRMWVLTWIKQMVKSKWCQIWTRFSQCYQSRLFKQSSLVSLILILRKAHKLCNFHQKKLKILRRYFSYSIKKSRERSSLPIWKPSCKVCSVIQRRLGNCCHRYAKIRESMRTMKTSHLTNLSSWWSKLRTSSLEMIPTI